MNLDKSLAVTEIKTKQQRVYEAAYASADSEYGMPDRKIADASLRGKRILSIGCGTGNDSFDRGSCSCRGTAHRTTAIPFWEWFDLLFRFFRSEGRQRERI